MRTIKLAIREGSNTVPISVSGGSADAHLALEVHAVNAITPAVDVKRVESDADIIVQELSDDQ